MTLVHENSSDQRIVIRIGQVAKDQLIKRFRKAFRSGDRWVVLLISRGGYLVRSSCFKGYFDAARFQSDNEVTGLRVVVAPISHIVKLLAGTVRSKLSAKEVLAIRGFMLSQFGLCIADRTLLSQCFLLKEFFPISLKTGVRLCDVLGGFSLDLDVEADEWIEPVREFPTATAILVQLSQLIVNSGRLIKGAKGFSIYGELDAWAANMMGDGGRMALYRGRISEDGRIEMASVIELVDPYSIINLDVTLIARYAERKREITFYDDKLRKSRLGYRGALPGSSCWNMQPIIFSN